MMFIYMLETGVYYIHDMYVVITNTAHLHICVLVKALLHVHIKYSLRHVAEMLIKHKAKPSAF